MTRTKLLLPFLLPATLWAQGDPAILDRLISLGKTRNQAMRHLRELVEIGPRVTGSPALYRAETWAMGKFKSWGLQNVHLEQWGEVPVGFERGSRQVGRMISPFPVDLVFSTNNWVPGTKGPVRAAAVREPKTMDELNANRKKLKGAWIVCAGKVGMRGPVNDEAPEVRKALDDLGIAGRIFGTPSELVWSHGTFQDKTFEKRPTEVEVSVRRSDFDRIARNIDYGRSTVLEFDIDNHWIKGPIPQYNTIAEIPGSEKPNEVVIVSGHLDSWNAPGSQGACDNGTGVSKALEAARLLMAAGAKPKRTIRFVLWSGEEEGLLGSQGYVRAHQAELDKISAVLVDDAGTGYHAGYGGYASMRPMMEQAFAPTARAFPDKPIKYEVVKDMTEDAGSDHNPFNKAGVPGFDTWLEGKYDYMFIWHTQNDRIEQVIPEYMVQASTNFAVVAYNLANAATLLPRER